MGYLKISRELLNSSFWRSLAPAEKGILIDLMAMAAYKPTSINLGGVMIPVQINELCFFANSISEYFGLSINRFRRLIDKLTVANLCTKEIRKMRTNESNCKSHCKSTYKKTQHYTCLSFYQWVFAGYDKQDTSETDQTTLEIANHEHNQLSINQEEKEKNSACAVPSFESQKDQPYKKTWYSMDEIAELNFAYADEILADWIAYSGRSEKEVREKLKVFTKKKLRLGLTKMTMDIFDQEFRKEIKTASTQNSKHKNEPVRKLKELGTDD